MVKFYHQIWMLVFPSKLSMELTEHSATESREFGWSPRVHKCIYDGSMWPWAEPVLYISPSRQPGSHHRERSLIYGWYVALDAGWGCEGPYSHSFKIVSFYHRVSCSVENKYSFTYICCFFKIYFRLNYLPGDVRIDSQLKSLSDMLSNRPWRIIFGFVLNQP